MRSAIVMGSGRSGTSLVAGVIASAGHFTGRRPMPADHSNPKGYFEDLDVIAVNEQLLAPYTDELPAPLFTSPPIRTGPLRDGQRWLVVLPEEAEVSAAPDVQTAMRETLGEAAWCVKDPRFSYTLSAWEPVIGDALRVCVFREPARTANSMLTWAASRPVGLTFDGALEVWARMYSRILRRADAGADWVFVHYDQVLDGTALPRLAAAVDAPLDASFPDRALSRAAAEGAVPAPVAGLYRELCERAGHAG